MKKMNTFALNTFTSLFLKKKSILLSGLESKPKYNRPFSNHVYHGMQPASFNQQFSRALKVNLGQRKCVKTR